MIIKKQNFNLTPGYRGKWPFSVSEVSIIAMKLDQKNICYGIMPPDCPEAFALSGILESHGFRSLDFAGIWLDGSEVTGHIEIEGFTGGMKKSLSPFFEYLKFRKVGIV